ncbi:MAG: ABC transporter ATP-binding protein, partial [Eubacteriales bacterium]
MFAVELKNITKRFGGAAANNQVELLVKQGDIHCLLGENGAGKTTLMKILFGLYKADQGTISINGTTIHNMTPPKAFDLGIGMVHQHFMLVENLSVLDNVILGSEPGRVTVNRKKAKAAVQELSDRYHFDLPLDEKVSELSIGLKSRVEIMKTIYRGADIIILDEPTAVLTPLEVRQFLDILLDMKKQGKTIILITHKLHETMEVSDAVTVLRGGQSVATVATADTNPRALASLMVGRDLEAELEKPESEKGDVVLSLENIRLLPQSQNPVSFQIRGGEIFGIAGVEGNGQKELEELVMGLAKCKEGKISLKTMDITNHSTQKRQKFGIGYIPSDRFKRAILPDFSLTDNYLLGNQYFDTYIKHGLIQHKALAENCLRAMEDFDVRAVTTGAKQPIGGLSGGNQQKFVLGREVLKDPELVVACQPIRGLDIGAIQFIHRTLLDLRAQGKAVLLISAELSELFQLSDRIGVLYKGELMAVDKAEAFDNTSISLLMAGRKEEHHA